MKAALYKSKGQITIEDIKKPELTEKGAIVKVHACGLCGSDIVKLRQGLVKENAVLGHEVVGTIEQINSDTSFKTAEKIALGHHVPCYKCKYCKGQSYSMCKKFKETNIIPGGFCEYIYISEDHLKNTVFKIPPKVTYEETSYMEPAACCLRAVKRAKLKKDDNVLIIGLGSIGLLMGQIAKSFGANVTGCDIIDERIQKAGELGFDNVIKFTDLESAIKEYKKTTNNIGADSVFLCSGSSKSLPFAISAARDGGNLIVFSSISNNEGFTNNEIYYRELNVFGSYSPSPLELKESLEMIEKGIIKVDGIAKEYPLADIMNAVEDTISNKILKAYIKIEV